jgi:phosphoglucosamine mutase
MGRKLFGTDGVRGVAGRPPLDPATITALGMALGETLTADGLAERPVLIGMDTRESGPWIAAQLAEGLAARGIQSQFVGVVTTPGVAYLARTGGFAAGVMISASHNPFEDNGIKIFAATGYKLPDAEEQAIEEIIFRLLPSAAAEKNGLTTEKTASQLPIRFSARPYLDFLLSTLTARLSGVNVVLDCGNGAASTLAPELFREAGARVTIINAQPNGRNINLGSGALHVEGLQQKVLETRADAGVAFDGDADRAIMVSGSGRIVDGDATILIAASRLQADGHLTGNMVVATVMSNLGLEKALERLGISMDRTPVGDKYVLEEMLRRGAALGGEQSGHVIFREYATTGDGMLTALKTLETSVRESRTLDELTADFTVFPQKLVNVWVSQRRPLQELPRVVDAIQSCEQELNGSGRVLVRFSGTEPLARVMVEAADHDQVELWTGRIADAIRGELG